MTENPPFPTLTIFVDGEDVTARIRKFEMNTGPDVYGPPAKDHSSDRTTIWFDPPVRSDDIQIFAEWDGAVYPVYDSQQSNV